MTFLFPPSFQTGGVLSASQLNHLLTDIDTLYGWHYGPWYGCDQLQYDTTQLASTVEGWAGWVVLTGDTLKVQLANFTAGVGLSAKVYFDGVQVGQPSGYTSAGVKTIALPIAANGWQQWTPYRVSVVTVRPQQTGELDVTNCYLVNSTTPSAGTLPSFADTEMSDAADFNAIADGIRTVEPAFVQPVAGCRGGEEYITQGANTGWTTVASWKMQHRLDSIRVSLFVKGAMGNAQGGSLGDVSARILYNSVAVNGAQWDTSHHSYTRVTDELFTLPGGLTVGAFYDVALQIKQTVSWLTEWFVRPVHIYEDQNGLASGYNETTRWVHGDYAIGDSDPAGEPMLYDMSANLSGLSTAAGTSGAVNVVQREPIDTFSFPYHLSADRRVYHVRRWRWLAYKKQPWYTEQGTNGLPATLEPSINWTYDGITWDSYRLPELDGDGGFYDLDSSPIVVGMTFYATGVQYAIQSPYPGYEP